MTSKNIIITSYLFKYFTTPIESYCLITFIVVAGKFTQPYLDVPVCRGECIMC